MADDMNIPRLTPRMTREQLSSLLLRWQDPQTPQPRLVIIDVRDSDHVGGHISTSQHVPSSTFDTYLPTLVRTCRDADIVVFHCALSQERGPRAAKRYLNAVRESQGVEGSKSVRDRSGGEDRDGEVKTVGEVEGGRKKQEVFVLDGGFVKWQELYGEDDRLTEAYAKDIWRDFDY